MEILNKESTFLTKTGVVFLIVLALYFFTKTVVEVKNYNNLPAGTIVNTISFQGDGEVFAVPDLATVSLTIRETAKDVKTAQDKVTTKESAVLEFLDKNDIDKKDIKTENYSSYPKYDYGIPCYGGVGIPCRQDAPKIIGYEVSEYISVKIRDLANVGKVLQGIGAVGVSEISGPNFSIENEDNLKAEARKLAIEDAKAKAKILSNDLGVSLVRIVSFSENGNYPMMYSVKGAGVMDSVSSAPSPELPTGENKIISNVTITYEIR